MPSFCGYFFGAGSLGAGDDVLVSGSVCGVDALDRRRLIASAFRRTSSFSPSSAALLYPALISGGSLGSIAARINRFSVGSLSFGKIPLELLLG